MTDVRSQNYINGWHFLEILVSKKCPQQSATHWVTSTVEIYSLYLDKGSSILPPPHQHLVMERGGARKASPLPGYAYRQLTVAREVEFLKPHPSLRIHGQLMDTGGRRDNFFSGAAPGKLSRLLYLFNPSSILLQVTWSELIAGREESTQAPTPASYGSRREANEEEGRWGRGMGEGNGEWMYSNTDKPTWRHLELESHLIVKMNQIHSCLWLSLFLKDWALPHLWP